MIDYEQQDEEEAYRERVARQEEKRRKILAYISERWLNVFEQDFLYHFCSKELKRVRRGYKDVYYKEKRMGALIGGYGYLWRYRHRRRAAKMLRTCLTGRQWKAIDLFESRKSLHNIAKDLKLTRYEAKKLIVQSLEAIKTCGFDKRFQKEYMRFLETISHKKWKCFS
jgi:hypothetical protein